MASTIPANVAYSVTCGGYTWTGEPAELAQVCAYLETATSGLPYVGRSTGTNIKVISPGQPFISYPLSVSSASCPWPYTVNGTVCELGDAQEASFNWMLANQSTLQNVLDNYALIVQGNTPYDYAQGGMIFSSMLIATLSLYFLVRNAMVFVELAKKASRL